MPAHPCFTGAPARSLTMNTRSFFTLITAATAVTALAAGMLLAINAPVPSAEEFGQATTVTTSNEPA